LKVSARFVFLRGKVKEKSPAAAVAAIAATAQPAYFESVTVSDHIERERGREED